MYPLRPPVFHHRTLVTLCLAAAALLSAPVFAETATVVPAGPPTQLINTLASSVVPVVAIIMVFGAPALAVILLGYYLFRYRERRQRLVNERIRHFLEAGQPVPESVLQEPAGRLATPEQHLQHGLLMIGLGLGVLVSLTLLLGYAYGALGLILLGVGGAKLLIWRLASRHSSGDESA